MITNKEKKDLLKLVLELGLEAEKIKNGDISVEIKCDHSPLSSADTLLVTVEDDKKCATSWYTPVVISEIVNIELSKTITAETCNENDGFLKVIASNGEGSYDFILVSLPLI